MPRNSDTFWSRVLFKDFIRHFRKMSPEEIAEDIAESMDALDDLNPDGDSFGSLMVRWANERMNGAFATAARENGKKGGRPRKNPEETTAETAALDSQVRTGDGSVRGSQRIDSPVRSLPLPTWEDFLSFVDGEGLDYSDAREWWEMTIVERAGKDRFGNPIGNWKGACKRFCGAKKKGRG